MPIIDFHSHILPGIDDGSSNVEMSLDMLHMAVGQGVGMMIATPHFYASRRSVEDFVERRQKAYMALKEQLTDHLPALMLGAEVAFFPGISRAEKLDLLTVEGTNLLLLEMPFAPWTDSELQEVKSLIRAGRYRVIFAHLERYMAISANRKKIEELQTLPVYVQVNAESFLDWRKWRTVSKMIRPSAGFLLGSDCHGLHHRAPNLGEGRTVIRKKLGDEFLKRIDETGNSLLPTGGEENV